MIRRVSICLACASLTLLPAVAGAADGTITTFAGTVSGFAGDGGPANQALLDQPEGMGIAPDGSVYIADAQNHRIRRVAPNGIITTIAGDGVQGLGGDGGNAFDATFDTPTDVAFGADGSYYIADSGNHRIRRVAPDGVISTFAGTVRGLAGDSGLATSARMDTPRELAIAPDGALLVVDAGNHRIRRVASGVITTVAGTTAGLSGDGGPATAAQLNTPKGVTVTADGGMLIADAGNHRVRKVAANGSIRTVAGTASGFTGDGGRATAGALSGPADVVEIANGGFLVADLANNRIRRVTPLGTIFTVSGGGAGLGGDGGPASAGQLRAPAALQFAPGGGILVGDTANHRIRRLSDIGQVPDPQRLRSVGVRPFSGAVSVRPTGTSAFIALKEQDLTANASDVNANAGALDVTVRNGSGGLNTARVSGGSFRATQAASAAVLTDLRLTETLSCGAKATQATAKKTRRLRVRVKGKFRTIGRYASAIARGTAWTITDSCDRTVIRVTEGTVTVRNRRTGRLLSVSAGQRRTILSTGRVLNG